MAIWKTTKAGSKPAVRVKPPRSRKNRAVKPHPSRIARLSKQGKLETALTSAQAELAAVNRQLADQSTYTNSDCDKINQLNTNTRI
jgi:ATP-binding cassette, subfamily F, member 3